MISINSFIKQRLRNNNHYKKIKKKKKIGEYHDLYVKTDILFLAAVFENCRKMCFKINYLDPIKFLSAPGLDWQAALKKTEEKYNYLLILICC